MKVCIVGGTGNISTPMVDLLLRQGHEVTVFNRGQRHTPPEGVRVITGDRSNREEFESTMQREKFDVAIDMICFSPEDAASDLRAFRDVSHFVQCSTVCTYGIQSDWLPVTEDHPLRPISNYGRNKVACDNLFLEAFYRDGFPVTIIKPSSTYGPQMGLLRQVAWEFSWIARVRQGKPIVVCGDGNALFQFLYVDDAAPAFAGVLGKKECLGQIYNMVRREFVTWADYHRLAMKVIGREVELVGVSLEDLIALNVPGVSICREIFAHHGYYSAEKLFRDVPDYHPVVSLEEGMNRVLEAMDRDGRVPVAEENGWEDRLMRRSAWCAKPVSNEHKA
jgi:nucleoside-diphosphate-sugar epimerase